MEKSHLYDLMLYALFFLSIIGQSFASDFYVPKGRHKSKSGTAYPTHPLCCNARYNIFFIFLSLFSEDHASTERPSFPHPSNPGWLFHYSIRGAISWRLSEAEDAAPFSSTSNHSLSCITSWQCRFDFFLPVHSVIFCCDIMK